MIEEAFGKNEKKLLDEEARDSNKLRQNRVSR
jgi:hypothetical protein